MKRAFATLLVGLAIASSAPARAEPHPEAVAAYKKGRALLAQKKPEEALAELRRSLMMLPSPNTELLIGHALRDLERYGEAMATYERVLDDAAARVQAGEARYQRTLEEAGRWSAALRPKVGKLVVTVSGSATDATLRVDGRDITLDDGRTGFWVTAGTVTAVVTTPDGRQDRGEATVSPATTSQTIALTLPAPEPDAPPPPPPAPVVSDEPITTDGDEGFPLPPWPAYAAAGAGVVGFALFAGLGAASASTASDLDECAPSCPESLRQDADAGKRNQLIANVGLGIGITGLAAAGTIWVLDVFVFGEDDSASDEASDLALRIGPTGATISGSF